MAPASVSRMSFPNELHLPTLSTVVRNTLCELNSLNKPWMVDIELRQLCCRQ